MTTPSNLPPESDKPQQTSWDRARDVVITFVACLILAAFAVLVITMFHKLTAAENEWTRAIYLYTGVEAIVFAAAGFLFGREVNRQRAEAAEKTANAVTLRSEDAQRQLLIAQAAREKSSTSSQALLLAIQAKINAKAAPGRRQAGADAALADLHELLEIARGLLP